jgi:hypothetical protein
VTPAKDSRPEVAGQISLFDLDPSDSSSDTALKRSSTDDAEEIPAENVDDNSQNPDTSEVEASPTDLAVEATQPPALIADRLPPGDDADAHAIVITADGAHTPSGRTLTGPVDSTDKLAKLIGWAGLQPMGAPAQIWIVGMPACELLGWVIDPGSEDDKTLEQLRADACAQLEHLIGVSLEPLLAQGWELRGTPGHRIHLSRTYGKATAMVDIVLEPYAWTMWNSGDTLGVLGTESDDDQRSTELPEADRDAARELGRRLAWTVRNLGVLPGHTGARTGAAVLDKIRRERKRSGKGLVVDAAGPVPPIDGQLPGDLEPAALWTRLPEPGELDTATMLVTVDQRAAYLASAGMLSFGHGTPRHTDAADSATAARENKRPFGLWRVTLPATRSINVPDTLPPPHPHMHPDKPVTTWVSTVSLDGLNAPVVDGGAGLDIDDLDISEAWLYPHQGRALDKWAKTLRSARQVTVDTDDQAMKEFTGACYKGYIGRMLNPDMWTSTRMVHHHQPLWRATIMAHSRLRGRRAAMRIATDIGRWPLRTVTDSWVYALGDGERIDDDNPALGKLTLEKHAPLSRDVIDELYQATAAVQVRDIIARTYNADDEARDNH